MLKIFNEKGYDEVLVRDNLTKMRVVRYARRRRNVRDENEVKYRYATHGDR
jgi:hypothetical protein